MDNSQHTLSLVGTGIKTFSHLTEEVKLEIQNADCVLYLVNEPLLQMWIEENSKTSYSLDSIYQSHIQRADAYKAISIKIVDTLEQYRYLSVVFYGHPTILSQPAISALKLANQKGYKTRIFPGISSEDCLYADLKINPGHGGVISYEATDFLIYHRIFSPNSHLILWQIGIIGLTKLPWMKNTNCSNITLLKNYLCTVYDKHHEVVVYEAALYPHFEPKIQNTSIKELDKATLSPLSTLYVPPIQTGQIDHGLLKLLSNND